MHVLLLKLVTHGSERGTLAHLTVQQLPASNRHKTRRQCIVRKTLVFVEMFLNLIVFMHPFKVQDNEHDCDSNWKDDSTNYLASQGSFHVVTVIHGDLDTHQNLIGPA